MSKVVILSLDDLRHITMIKIYTEYLKTSGIPYDIICFDRYNGSEIRYDDATVYSFKGTDVKDSKVTKFIRYMKYRKYAISVMNKNKYDYIIVWGERTASVFSDYLVKHKPYCVNIRDIGFPPFMAFYKRLKKAVDCSDFSTWCAPRGEEELPPHKYVIVLNQNKNLVKEAKVSNSLVENDKPIRIGTIGYIRHIDSSKQIMKALCNDDRYIVQFFGTGADQLEAYAKELGMNNIELRGSFTSGETASLLDKTDVINSYCGDGLRDKTIAVGSPIRYGYSTLLYKPAIVSPNTYISDKTKELNIAFTVEDLETFPDKFYEWYHSLDFLRFKESCDTFNQAFDDSISHLHRVCDEKIKPVV